MVRQFHTPTYPAPGGVAPTVASAHVDGHAIPLNDGSTVLRVINGGAGATVITFDIPRTVDGAAITDPSVSIPAGAIREFSGFRPTIYAQPDGNLYFTFSVLTTVTLEVKLGQRGI
jgi:hypothetical protein